MSWLDDHRDLALSLLDLAVRAPSSHNTQPWVFRFHSDGVELLADRTRALPVNDPDDRELVVSCGAALFHLRIAALHLGLSAKTTPLPDERDPDLLARVELAPAAQGPGPVAQWVVRTFDMGDGVAAKDQQLAEHSPMLALLTTVANHPRSWLEAGQALARVLLTGCLYGLQASYLNQPVQVAVLRSRLARLAGSGVPQVLLRLGYPLLKLPASPRRAVEEVVDWDAGTSR